MVVKGGKLAKWEFKVRRVTPQEKKSIKTNQIAVPFTKTQISKLVSRIKLVVYWDSYHFLPHSLVIMEGPCLEISLDCNNLP